MTKKLVSIICCLTLVLTAFSSLFSVSAVEGETDNNDVGTTYYVSTLTGKDTNNGTSEDTPFYSLSKYHSSILTSSV